MAERQYEYNPYLNERGFDQVGFIMDLEQGDISDPDVIAECMQVMIDTGVVWQLQGSYGRMAQALIDAGYCTP